VQKPGGKGYMTRPFKGRLKWVMEFLTSSKGRVDCILFRTAGVLLPIIYNSTNAQRAESLLATSGKAVTAQRSLFTRGSQKDLIGVHVYGIQT
jgi:hypothetical protein